MPPRHIPTDDPGKVDGDPMDASGSTPPQDTPPPSTDTPPAEDGGGEG